MLRLAVALILSGTPASADAWGDKKCELYRAAFEDARVMLGSDGISDSFTDGNARFIASGCTEQIRLCPQSVKELELADMLTVMTMSEGMASTFVPFGCP
ncbi:hypothetical protein BDE40_0499 [Litoreibacter halocynthiae]|uniref:Uncharacterized protein n=1 Tax=Litoreibacter halocynthiae TaxID=1242689 RepID=A0A4R7LP22_9RHOB|nr:hypothetical protein [Litoreibacter halocynthiae]TDT77219.1 hypothetical protein BDE40_0499 [Litoreibacter halocynthiae]